jgi:limonene-1,2-epoxide hydrolase
MTERLSDDVALEIPGMPPFVAMEQAAEFTDELATEIPNLFGVTVAIETIAADGDLVFNERVDYHCDAQEKLISWCRSAARWNSRTARSRGEGVPGPASFLELVQ